MKTIALALLAAALATPAIAAEPEPQPQQHYSGKPKKPHLICRRDETTGSRMAKNVCKTAEEWAGTSIDDDQARMGVVTRATASGSGVVPTGN